MNHFWDTIGEPWFDFGDIYSYAVDNFTDDSHFVEVGSWKGRSASFMAVEIINSGKNIKFDCIDTWDGSIEHTAEDSDWVTKFKKDKDFLYSSFLKNTQPVSDVINPIRKRSHDAVMSYKNRSLDFIFLDGSHAYKDILLDLQLFYPKLKRGGIIGGHDYANFRDVKLAVHEFFNCDLLWDGYWNEIVDGVMIEGPSKPVFKLPVHVEAGKPMAVGSSFLFKKP
jgi:hypothetical protein